MRIKIVVDRSKQTDGDISIYYNQDFIVCHSLSEKKYNYKIRHMHEILKSDVYKHLSDIKIDEFIKESMSMMDILLGG